MSQRIPKKVEGLLSLSRAKRLLSQAELEWKNLPDLDKMIILLKEDYEPSNPDKIKTHWIIERVIALLYYSSEEGTGSTSSASASIISDSPDF